PPSPLTNHSCGGPAFGQDCSSPLSLERLLRWGPCHCGQSNGCGWNLSCAAAAAPQKTTTSAQAILCMRTFYCEGIGGVDISCLLRAPQATMPAPETGPVPTFLTRKRKSQSLSDSACGGGTTAS